MKNILLLVDTVSLVCGVSKHIRVLVKELSQTGRYNIFLIAGKIEYSEGLLYPNLTVSVDENLRHANRSKLGFLKAVIDIRRFIKKHKIDVVHSHHHYAANVAWQAARFLRTKTVFTNHGIIPEIGLLNHFKGNEIIAVNEHAVDYIKKKVNPDKVHLIRNGLVYSDFEKTHSEKLRMAASSRFDPGKGLDIFIKAAAKTKYKDKVDFMIIGEGVKAEELKALNKRVNANVTFYDPVSNLQEFLKSTDIFVCPSYSESFPISLVEAALSKNLILCSNFAGVESVLDSSEHGIIFPVGDVAKLAEVLDYAIENYPVLTKKAMAFHERCKSLFSLKLMLDSIEELYSN